MDDYAVAQLPLAVAGGSPLRRTPLPSWPVFDEEAVEAAAAVLRSGKVNYWTGTEGKRFEEEFAAWVGCRHAVAVANGTVALELALHALGIGSGDEVIVTCRSFIASASCCVARGARPVFADVDPTSQNVTAETIRAAITPRTRAIIAVHLAGWPCDMDPIMDLADRHHLVVIEDCAQAHGAMYRGRMVGSIGHAAAFSFCQDKILTTGGEGGMLTTDDPAVWRRAWSYKDHGKDWHAVHAPGGKNVFRWLHASLGSNWRMTEMQAAIGRVFLRKLPDWLATRRRNAAILDQRLTGVPGLRLATPPEDIEHAYYKYYVFLRLDELWPGWTRDDVAQAIQAEGIPCGSGICPEIYMEKAFADTPFQPLRRLPNARRLGQTSLMLQVHPTLTPDDVEETATAVEKVMNVAAADALPAEILPLRKAA